METDKWQPYQVDGGELMLLTSGDWNIDIERDLTFGVFDFMCKKFNSLLDATVEVNQVDLREEFAYGFCQVDNDGEFLIHIHNDLDQREYITTLIHELVHVKQTQQGLKDDEMRESEAYELENKLYEQFMSKVPTNV